MGRDRGVYNMPGNIELSKEAPLDARRKVNTFAELFLEDTWKDSNNRVWLYDGMTVEVGDRLGELWQLKSKTSYSNPEDWIRISGGIEDAPKDGTPYMRQDGKWKGYTQIEEVYTFAPTIIGNKITQEDYNGLKAAIEAGKIIAYGQQGMNGNYVATLSASMEDAIHLMTFAGDSFQVFTVTPDLIFTDESEYLILKNNIAEYEVIGDYNPAHKKYVDEAVVANSYKVLPGEVLDITQGMASDDIFAKFGGKSAYLDFVKNTPTNSIIRVEGGALCVASMISYTNDNTNTLDIQTLGLNASQYIRVTVSGGTASALTAKYIFVNESDVLKKNNTTYYTPTKHYHPATKDYVDTVHYGVDVECDGSYISENNDFTGASAVDLVKSIFTNYQQIVTHIITLHKPLFIHINGNYSCIACNSIYAYKDDNAKTYELSFTYTLSYSTGVKCKIFGFHIEENTEANSWCIIKDLVQSDNVAALTKKTSTEYSNINPKADNTAYLVTDD